MNKLRNMRHKSPAAGHDDSMPPGEDHVRGASGGLFNKIKRYSTVSHKLMRRSSGNHNHTGTIRKHSPHRSSGSYDMTGDSSRDLRPEIGAPVLITTTALDIDKITTITENKSVIPASSSSDSDTDVFADASASIQDFGNIKFQFFEEVPSVNNTRINLSTSTEEGDYELVPSPRSVQRNSSECEQRSPVVDQLVKAPMRKNKSRSVSNLHSPSRKLSLELRNPNRRRHPVSSVDLRTVEYSDCDEDVSGYYNEPYDGSDKENSSAACNNNKEQVRNNNWIENKNISDNNQPGREMEEFKRSLSVIVLHQTQTYDKVMMVPNSLDKSVTFSDSKVVDEEEEEQSRDKSLSSMSDDFDMKSASFEDLQENGQMFLSIEEFNALTKEINESEEFNNSITEIIDPEEYCDHRSNLQPNQRRVTLMRNKPNKIQLNLNDKRGKITSVWSGIKSWIGEERGKIKEVVQRHSAMQRVGANLKSPTRADNGPSAEGGVEGEGDDAAVKKDKTQSRAENAGEDRESEARDDLDIGVSTERDSRDLSTVFHTVLRQKSKSSGTSATTTTAAAEGQNGFEELRRYVKQGGDFGKDLAAILQERLEAEYVYSKSLSKMASKLNKTCREIPGSLAEAWRGVAQEMEKRGDVHRQFSKSLTEEIVKPLKEILDGQHKTRKTMENTVDKSARLLAEWRQTEAKSKKTSHAAARENEKLQDALLDVRISRSPSISLLSHRGGHGKSPEKQDVGGVGKGLVGEKDSKLDGKRRKAEESVKKADVEYYQLCVRAERARVDWEMDVLRSSVSLQALETQRLSHMKNCIAAYLKLSQDMCPLLSGAVERLAPTIASCNVQKDMNVIKNIRRASEGPSEQLLPDFYCEHTTLAMNRERRKQALVKLLQLVRQDLERERRSRNGLRGISQQLNNSSDTQSITDKLYHIRSMLTYLEGTRYKLQATLMELDHKQRGTHPLAVHIQVTRDRHGLQQSILKVPLWLKNTEGSGDSSSSTAAAINSNGNDDEYVNRFIEPTSPMDVRNEAVIGSYARSVSHLEMTSPCQFTAQSLTDSGDKVSSRSGLVAGSNNKSIDDGDRGNPDGGSNQHDSDFDEFSSHDEAEEEDVLVANKSSTLSATTTTTDSKREVIGRCRAMYSYAPKLYDELELEPGDIIEIHTKEENGWWLGALNNRIGIFPATYVEELPV